MFFARLVLTLRNYIIQWITYIELLYYKYYYGYIYRLNINNGNVSIGLGLRYYGHKFKTNNYFEYLIK